MKTHRRFEARSDWFEAGILPAIRRRSVIAIAIIASCVVWWTYTYSLIPVGLASLVIIERLFEFSNIPSIKKLVASMSIESSEKGLMLRGNGIDGGVLYPWGSLRTYCEKSQDGDISSITIEDATRKRSKVCLKGYEGMGELNSIIEQRSNES